jgi:acetylornithine deacetylase
MRESTAVIQPKRLRHLLRRLIDIYSPSGKELQILDFLHGYLKHYGVPVVRQPVDEGRYNVVVAPPGADIRLALVGHVDTVVAADLDHHRYEEQGDLISGLGAADAKGGCAAMVEAYLALWERDGARVPAALALVVGEEEEGDGADRLIKDYHFPWALIGEPTDLQPCLSHYGYVEVHLRTRGKRMHASLATPESNPIEAMIRVLTQISPYIRTSWPGVVYNIRELVSSRAGFVIPDWCEAWLDIHLPPTAPTGEITQQIKEALERKLGKSPHLNAMLHFPTVNAGYELPEKGPVVDALKEIYARRSFSWESKPFRSSSDAHLLWEAGVKPILLGPGQLEKAHIPEESVSFQHVCLAAELYLDLLVSLSS